LAGDSSQLTANLFVTIALRVTAWSCHPDMVYYFISDIQHCVDLPFSSFWNVSIPNLVCRNVAVLGLSQPVIDGLKANKVQVYSVAGFYSGGVGGCFRYYLWLLSRPVATPNSAPNVACSVLATISVCVVCLGTRWKVSNYLVYLKGCMPYCTLSFRMDTLTGSVHTLVKGFQHPLCNSDVSNALLEFRSTTIITTCDVSRHRPHGRL
jgi:hypothetical protein